MPPIGSQILGSLCIFYNFELTKPLTATFDKDPELRLPARRATAECARRAVGRRMPADPAEAEGAEGSNAAPAPSRPAPTKVAYHPNVRCLRGGGGKGKFEGLGFDPSWPHPVIVRPMYRVGEGYVCEQKATEEEKANGPVEPAQDDDGNMVNPVLEGFDLRGWAVADIQGLRGADGKLDLEGAILCGVDLRRAQLQGADLTRAQLQGAGLRGAQLQGADLGEA